MLSARLMFVINTSAVHDAVNNIMQKKYTGIENAAVIPGFGIPGRQSVLMQGRILPADSANINKAILLVSTPPCKKR